MPGGIIGPIAPGVTFETVTTDVAFTGGLCRSLWVGTGGDVAVVDVNGSATTIPNVQDGTLLPLRATKVNTSGTTASDMVAFF